MANKTININYALVLSRNEFDSFICRYNKRIDQVIEHINAIDMGWGERIYVSRLELNRKMSMLNLYECDLLPCHITDGVSVFHLEKFAADEAECELLIRKDKNILWKALNGQDIIALYLPEGFSCYSEKAYIDSFRNLVEQYLPHSFDYSSHIGPLRVRSRQDRTWCFERADAEAYVNTLLGANDPNLISTADTDDTMELPF